MNPLNPFPGFNPGCNISLPICRTTNQWLGSGPAPAVVPNYQVTPESQVSSYSFPKLGPVGL